jgi:hypothetical protein
MEKNASFYIPEHLEVCMKCRKRLDVILELKGIEWVNKVGD